MTHRIVSLIAAVVLTAGLAATALLPRSTDEAHPEKYQSAYIACLGVADPADMGICVPAPYPERLPLPAPGDLPL